MDTDIYKTNAETVYEEISHKIITGAYPPGMRLSRRQIAAELGVSSIPVLEALKRLEQDGLVEYRPYLGSSVTTPTEDKIKDMFAFREAIECQVARILSQHISEQTEIDLRSIADELDLLRYTLDNPEKTNDKHLEFHLALAEATGYPSLVSGLKKINFTWLLFNAIISRRKHPITHRRWHGLLLDKIFLHDPDIAEEAMRIHIKDSMGPMLESFNQALSDK
ncbi:MAG: GntR family transcriptional regulator [Spirochaetia bacterium]|jgi:DNA-binding GntR family transcriptional regulator|nr:GntR family transcriptional regulator [Spirochaetia bacterium]